MEEVCLWDEEGSWKEEEDEGCCLDRFDSRREDRSGDGSGTEGEGRTGRDDSSGEVGSGARSGDKGEEEEEEEAVASPDGLLAVIVDERSLGLVTLPTGISLSADNGDDGGECVE